MRIQGLIAHLQKLQRKHGNLVVRTRNQYGERVAVEKHHVGPVNEWADDNEKVIKEVYCYVNAINDGM